MPSPRFDLFPAFVVFVPKSDTIDPADIRSAPPHPKQARNFDKARIIVTQTDIMVAIDSETGPKIIFKEEIIPDSFVRSADKTKDSYVTAKNGTKLAFRKNDACGCGSRLRSWNPYRTLHSTKNP